MQMIHPPRLARQRFSETLVAWGFLLPGGVLLLGFLVVPFALAVGYSFTNLRLISPLPLENVGWQNYVRTLHDPLFRQALTNNFLFVAIVVPIQTTFALFLALLVNQKLPGVKIFRTIYFLPVVTIIVVAATIWKVLYQPDQGLFNAMLNVLTAHHFHPAWLFDPHTALAAIIITSIWQGVGFQMVIILAGLQDIPEELYESAAVDGASPLAQFLFITLPQLRNTLIFVATVTIILAFQLFDQVYVMTQGGPNGSTETTLLHLVEVGFGRQQIGLSSAISVIFFCIVLVVSLGQRLLIREEGERV